MFRIYLVYSTSLGNGWMTKVKIDFTNGMLYTDYILKRKGEFKNSP